MKRIGIISDTHGFLDDRFVPHLKECDQIWHAGDIGNLGVVDKLSEFAEVKAVYGNIDNHQVRSEYTEVNRFNCEGADVMIKHIVGKPGGYDFSMKQYLLSTPPSLLIAGHSHILKIQNDPQLGFLFINPGAAGKSGLHTVQTMVKITVEKGSFKDCKVVELTR